MKFNVEYHLADGVMKDTTIEAATWSRVDDHLFFYDADSKIVACFNRDVWYLVTTVAE